LASLHDLFDFRNLRPGIAGATPAIRALILAVAVFIIASVAATAAPRSPVSCHCHSLIFLRFV
jgi:hypothetical protein